MESSTPLLVMTATPTRAIANRIGKILLKNQLIASIHVSGPISSHYRFKGKLFKGREWNCIIRTTRENFLQVEKTISALHPYEVPEILAIPILKVSHATLKWIRASCAEPQKGSR